MLLGLAEKQREEDGCISREKCKLSRWDLISAGADCFLSTSHSGATPRRNYSIGGRFEGNPVGRPPPSAAAADIPAEISGEYKNCKRIKIYSGHKHSSTAGREYKCETQKEIICGKNAHRACFFLARMSGGEFNFRAQHCATARVYNLKSSSRLLLVQICRHRRR
jgi:hypothetical protein